MMRQVLEPYISDERTAAGAAIVDAVPRVATRV
jgi:hypothetical protein